MKSHKQFPALHELRFLAALGVIVFHFENVKSDFGIPNVAFVKAVGGMGTYGVQLFFVTSGFLITYLLLSEINSSGKIDLRAFYRKRVVRIAPLYWLVVGVCFFLFPVVNALAYRSTWTHLTTRNVLLHFAFLPQIALDTEPLLVGASQFWSIGIEMQFYLLWPLMIYALWRRPLVLFSTGYFFTFIIRAIAVVLRKEGVGSQLYWLSQRVDLKPLVVGGMIGWALFYEKQRILNVLFHPVTQVVSLLGMLAVYILGEPPAPFYFYFRLFTVDAFLLAVIVINACGNPKTLFRLRFAPMERLGKASYGIYCYHLLVVYSVLGIFRTWMATDTVVFQILAYTTVLGVTFLISDFSFRYFELPLMNRFKLSKKSLAQQALSEKPARDESQPSDHTAPRKYVGQSR